MKKESTILSSVIAAFALFAIVIVAFFALNFVVQQSAPPQPEPYIDPNPDFEQYVGMTYSAAHDDIVASGWEYMFEPESLVPDQIYIGSQSGGRVVYSDLNGCYIVIESVKEIDEENHVVVFELTDLFRPTIERPDSEYTAPEQQSQVERPSNFWESFNLPKRSDYR